MSKVKVLAFGVSIDGFGAGPDQSLENPLGVGGPGLHQWFFPTRTFQQMHGGGGPDAGTTRCSCSQFKPDYACPS